MLREQAMHISKRAKKGNQAVAIGFLANILLAVLKTSIGILGHSS